MIVGGEFGLVTFFMVLAVCGVIIENILNDEIERAYLMKLKNRIISFYSSCKKFIITATPKIGIALAYFLQASIMLFISGVCAGVWLCLIIIHPVMSFIILEMTAYIIFYHLSGRDFTEIPMNIYNFIRQIVEFIRRKVEC